MKTSCAKRDSPRRCSRRVFTHAGQIRKCAGKSPIFGPGMRVRRQRILCKMRPQILFPLFAEVGELKGIGPSFAKLIAKAAGPRVVDLLWHLPSGLLDWSKQSTTRDAETGQPVTLKLLIVDHSPPRIQRLPYKIRASDDTGYIDLVCFKAKGDY